MVSCGSNRQAHYNLLKIVEEKRKKLNGIVGSKNKNKLPDQHIPPYVVCYHPGCFVPQALCNRRSGGNQCRYADILLDVIHIILSLYRQEAETVFEQVGGELCMYRLLTKKSSNNANHLLVHKLFLELCQKFVNHNAYGA